MKILVPTDFSDNANNAFEFAKKIARLDGSSVTLLFAYYSVYDFAAQSSSIVVQIEQAAQRAMDELKTDSQHDVRVYHKIIQGSIATAVTSTAYRENYDLIIMGTQGASGIQKALIGSNTTHVIKDSKVPVLAVPYHATFEMVSQLVISLEWTAAEKQYLAHLFRIAHRWPWPYHTLTVRTPHSHPTAVDNHDIKNLFDSLDLRTAHKEVEANDLLEGIKKYLQKAEDSLLVMFSKNRPFLEYLFHQDHVEKMAYHTHVPLLVIK